MAQEPVYDLVVPGQKIQVFRAELAWLGGALIPAFCQEEPHNFLEAVG